MIANKRISFLQHIHQVAAAANNNNNNNKPSTEMKLKMYNGGKFKL